ncbi:MAG: bifunctional 4-hydroxy-3-methylbut-2-enyl diphosphate reductase/30S ribosomal protein S1 [Candidatus Pseudoruminococcus sp.]|uniref:bifunctional 4-hydroxy-3-methylbut-2-enyl diphosphate reductase/30S ribosomal protein S1 n=1 Tax=Candidatus Pseudoruminococcus sp. TaxID=3101048 RepID=UPI002A77D6A6|nr:bifunctional 4-hydroxy-3-methylbut-2-enyl diphosphate reductase/30S ribosomal protein S1 [Ruminococcus sp.]MDY2782344.1 bifunctional 4-hydroxy-3-methylbut-2-enyl diphosphate reductase/30S ribosomal protein S1 [Candidatus Pseudoruminococcus sp.]
MKIILAKSAGFCFGVNRAVTIVNNLLDEGKKVTTLGPIIHNPHMVAELAERGVEIADTPDDLSSMDRTLVIRSHGVPQSVIDEIEQKGISYENATCPFVSKIHKIVKDNSHDGKVVLIAGDENHPEVQGIVGHCEGEHYIFKDHEDLEKLLKKFKNVENISICVVAQTTYDVKEWKNCLKLLKKVYTNAKIFDTICSATSIRQSEAEELASISDIMVVIGGRQSSNTAKLFSVCKSKCERTYLIESVAELDDIALIDADIIGITAGASTPARIIKEVFNTMTENIEKTENTAENFAELLEESLKNFNTDEKVHGVVVGIAPNEVYVDVGRKQAGFIPLAELSNDPNAKAEDLVKIGDELDLLIMRTNDQEGTIMLSKKRLDAIKGWDEIIKANEEDTPVTGFVTDVVKGGVIAVANGVRVFIPASQATATRGEPLENLLKKEVTFKIIEVNKGRRRAVGSIRAILKEERQKLADKFWETAEIGKKYTGTVKSLTSYGAFVDIGGIDGMIHISELSWGRIKHPSEVVKVGDTVEVYIKDLDREKGKISLGYKNTEDNPWEILKRDYPEGTVTEATIVGMTDFGAFANILPGIDGLIHISQISTERIEKPQDVLKIGDKVTVKITKIDFDKKRISLSIRELLEDQKSEEATEE